MKKTLFIISIIFFSCSIIDVAFYHYRKTTIHSASAYDFIISAFFYGVAIILFGIGLGLLKMSNIKNKRKVLMPYLILISLTFIIYFFVTAENTSPVVLQAKTEYYEGLSIKFRSDSTFRLEKQDFDYSAWYEGTYTVSDSNLFLICEKDDELFGLDKKVLLNRDTLYCNKNGEDKKKLICMHVVLNNLKK